jgi:cell division septation protein DedD
MLQVGAMAHKENADALVQALQRRNFPVFVSQGADRFYRVVVGPYTDVDSTLRAKEELKEQGFASIRTPRNRSAK